MSLATDKGGIQTQRVWLWNCGSDPLCKHLLLCPGDGVIIVTVTVLGKLQYCIVKVSFYPFGPAFLLVLFP